MTLTTFGAIMGFAAEVVGQTGGAYKALVQKAQSPTLRETLQSLLNEAGKNHFFSAIKVQYCSSEGTGQNKDDGKIIP